MPAGLCDGHGEGGSDHGDEGVDATQRHHLDQALDPDVGDDAVLHVLR